MKNRQQVKVVVEVKDKEIKHIKEIEIGALRNGSVEFNILYSSNDRSNSKFVSGALNKEEWNSFLNLIECVKLRREEMAHAVFKLSTAEQSALGLNSAGFKDIPRPAILRTK